MAGITVPEETKVLIGEVESVGIEEPFAHEKLSPVLAMYRAEDFEDAVSKAEILVEHGGFGHTSSLYTDPIKSKDRIEKFGLLMKTGRVIVNMPSALGAIGDIYNFKLTPSLTLGCGSWGGNSVSENVGVKHLLNIKTVAERRENMLWFKVPEKIYFKYGCLPVALKELKDMNKKEHLLLLIKLFITLDIPLRLQKLWRNAESVMTYFMMLILILHWKQQKGAERMKDFKPDVIIALGGGSPMDAAKIMWVLYEHPEAEFEDLAMRFMDIRKRVYKFPYMGEKATMVAIPTSSEQDRK